MKYYLIVGEASGDLHASNLMRALKEKDAEADFRFFGGDLMAAEGGTLVKHYRELAYMGFIPVLMHLPTIFKNMRFCKQDIVEWKPDALILVDYPGFNLNIAKYIHKQTSIPVFYYISPKIWAWKEYRIKNIKRDVDQLYSILPFEVDFYEGKHQYPIHYVGNPTLDEVELYKQTHPQDFERFVAENSLSGKPIIALLAGSRKQEIKDNLSRMIEAASVFEDFQLVLAGAPGISPTFYQEFLQGKQVKVVFGKTYELLNHASYALVTSGTATLETALFRVPQVVCYYTPVGRFISFMRKLILSVKYISLVNLVAGRTVVQELVADTMTVENMQKELERLIHDETYRQQMLEGYSEVAQKLGTTGAPQHTASLMTDYLFRKRNNTDKSQKQG
jgi:lipid-A-disaccharide synthase